MRRKKNWSRAVLFLVSLSSILLPFTELAAQSHWRSRADRLMEICDSLAANSQRGFHLIKSLDDKGISFKENWYYSLDRDRIAVFQIRYVIDTVEFNETYYLDRGQLFCAESYETVYNQYNEDEIRWGEVHYFSGQGLMQYTRLGNEKNPWGSAITVQDRFRRRLYELNKNLRW